MKEDTTDTRQHILDTGYRLMVTNGFTGVGLAEILSSAGVPKGSFYYYFKSKEQFGEEVITHYFANYVVRLDTLLGNQKHLAYDRLMQYWQLWIDTQSSDCEDRKCLVVKLSAEVADLSDTMRVALLQGSRNVISRIAKCIEDGNRDESIAQFDPQAGAESLYTMWLGASLMSKLHKSSDALVHAMATTKSILKNRTLTE